MMMDMVMSYVCPVLINAKLAPMLVCVLLVILSLITGIFLHKFVNAWMAIMIILQPILFVHHVNILVKLAWLEINV